MSGRALLGLAFIFLAALVFYIGKNEKDIFPTLYGEGEKYESVVDTFDIAKVDFISSNGQCDITYFYSDKKIALVHYKKNISQNLSSVVDNRFHLSFGTSLIKAFHWVIKDDIKVDIYTDNINHIRLNGSTGFTCKDTLSTDTFLFENEGLSRIVLLLGANKTRIIQSGAGSSVLRIHSKQLDYSGNGLGATEMKVVADKGEVSSKGAGSLKLTGKIDHLTLSNEGLGSLDAEGLKVNVLNVENRGAGSVSVNASDSISLSNHGLGSITYGGDALVKNVENHGMGNVSKR